MKTIINLLVLIILFFIVFAGYQVLFEEKEIKDVGKIFSAESKKLQGKGAAKILDLWIKENMSFLKYRDLKCFNDEKFGLSCKLEKPRLEKGSKSFSSDSVVIYGITDLGLKGLDVASYLNTSIRIKVEGLKLSPNFLELKDDTEIVFVEIALEDTDYVVFELINEEPSTGTIEFKSHMAFESMSSLHHRKINIILDTYGDKLLVENTKYLDSFLQQIVKLNLDSLNIHLNEGESKVLNYLLFKFLKGEGSYRDMINSESSESTAYYTLMASLGKDIHKDSAKKLANFLSYRSSELNLKISSTSYEDVKLESLISDFESGKLSSNKNVDMK